MKLKISSVFIDIQLQSFKINFDEKINLFSDFLVLNNSIKSTLIYQKIDYNLLHFQYY